MRGGSIAKRYATALLSVARGSENLESVQRDLACITQTITGFPKLQEAFDSPVIEPSKKKALFAKLQEKLKLDSAVVNLIRILIDQNRMPILPILATLYRDMTDQALGQVRVQVRVAAPLGSDEEKLQKILEKSLGKKVLLESQVDPSILGGLKVQVQDQVFDATLKNDLEKIKEAIIDRAVA